MISVAPNLTRAEPFAYNKHQSKITPSIPKGKKKKNTAM
uniref:Uncharacterized protein n=1 Tax=Arundo donax TaxID=35708 RepID=A0A0A9EDP0_ARUDO